MSTPYKWIQNATTNSKLSSFLILLQSIMKRFRFYGEEMKESIDSFKLANVLMLLSGGSAGTAAAAAGEVVAGKVFECKTCNRQFPSFQALGGHRASHKKPRLGGVDGVDQVNSGPAKPRVHECSVCGLEFSIGQALGGHMRRHRAVAGINGTSHGLWATEKEPVGEKTGVGLDLNLLPPLEVEEVTSPPKLLGFTLTPAIVDCMY